MTEVKFLPPAAKFLKNLKDKKLKALYIMDGIRIFMTSWDAFKIPYSIALNVACCKGFLYWWGAATDFPSDNVHGIKMSDGCGAASFKRLQSISAERLPISWRGNLMVASDGLV